ncbi:NADP-dependent 3-hydroxy acid dehydrogenase YdfG [Pseudomonas sp. TE36184]
MTAALIEKRQSIFITGAASGIGRAAARLFVERGWFVGLGDINNAALAELKAELGAQNVLSMQFDVASPEEWSQALSEFHRRTGRLDVLLNNAGILISGPFESSPLERHHTVIDINIKGLLNGCYLSLPYLIGTPSACVINLSSTAAIYGQASLATYSSTKFAVRGLTEALNIEWQRHGIRVIDIMPPFVQTDMIKGMNARSMERLGVQLTPENVAESIWAAANDQGDFSKPHRPVGFIAAWLFRLTNLAPSRLRRYIAMRIAT